MLLENQRLIELNSLKQKLEEQRAKLFRSKSFQSLDDIKNMPNIRKSLENEFPSFDHVGKWCYEDKFSYYEEQINIAIYFYKMYLAHRLGLPNGKKMQEADYQLVCEKKMNKSFVFPSDHINVLYGNIIYDDNIKLLQQYRYEPNAQNALLAYEMFLSIFVNFYIDDIGRAMADLMSKKTNIKYSFNQRDWNMIQPTSKSNYNNRELKDVVLQSLEENMSYVFWKGFDFNEFPYIEVFINYLIKERLTGNMAYITYQQMTTLLHRFIENEAEITKSLEPSIEARNYSFLRRPAINHPHIVTS